MIFWQFFVNLIIFINIILIGGILPLIERKYLSLIQRRVGPKFVGYKGRLQFIADALKMFLKGVIIPTQVNSFFFLFWPCLFLSICVCFWLNSFWGVNLIFLELEYNLVFLAIISIILNICIFLTGYFSKNKYALISSIRTLVVFFLLELVLAVFFLILILCVNSFHIALFKVIQEEYAMIFSFLLIIFYILILIMLEIAKSPFDLNEAETELVTGYHTEYGAFFFALFYLGEYFHLFFTAVFIAFTLIGL